MSRQLSRIRSLITDIEEIQKQGQSSHAHAAAPQEEAYAPRSEPRAQVVQMPKAAEEYKTPKVEAPKPEMGKIAIQLSNNVFVQLQIGDSNEIVEIRHLEIASRGFIEIRFADGKAVHLPLKAMA